MRIFLKTTAILIWGTLACLPHGWADQIVMTSGERFTSDKVWNEGDKIRFLLQGLAVSVPKTEVAAVIQADGNPAAPAAPTPKPAPAQPVAKPVTAVPLPSQPAVDDDLPAVNPDRPIRLPWATGEERRATPTPLPPRTIAMKGTGLPQATWGMAPGELPGLKKIKTDPLYGGIDQYWLPAQGLQFGDALLDGWVYNFWQGQLYSIIMWSDGRMGYERLRSAVFERYGKGLQRRPEVERFVWDDDLSQRMLEFDLKSQSGIFVMRSSLVDQRIKTLYPPAPTNGSFPKSVPKSAH